MHSNKISVIHLIQLLIKSGVSDFIISPGSRNAPLILELTNRKDINLYSIADERSAGFYALGMSMVTKKPTVVICTSGSALLNYLPSVSEAFYRNIPLIVISSDRPFYRIDKGEGQTINQRGALANFIIGEMNISLDENINDFSILDNEISRLIQKSSHPTPGPIHFNIEFEEPLYSSVESYDLDSIKHIVTNISSDIKPKLSKECIELFNRSAKVMILCGQMERNSELELILNKFSSLENVVILTETTANVEGEKIIPSIDKVVLTFGEEDEEFHPDLLITVGDAIISKIIKKFIRKSNPKYHFQIHPNGVFRNTYDVLSHKINSAPESFLTELIKKVSTVKSDYGSNWSQQYEFANKIHDAFLSSAPYSDLKVFEFILKNLPENINLHVSNSSPIRYHQLFDFNKNIRTYCNRGTSGIDGCLSTAAGFAIKKDSPTWFITGDVSFLYDSNAWWNNYKPDLKVILINNGGGGIFRILPGPKDIPDFETYFETQHDVNISKLCLAFDIIHYSANNIEEVALNLELLNESKGISVLEIKTPQTLNAEVLKMYFKALKEN